MSEATTYAEVVVPDSIEPVYGWKALKLMPDGRLCSPQQTSTVWPVKKRLEATCTNYSRAAVYDWKPVHGKGREMGLQEPPAGTQVFVSATVMLHNSPHIPSKPQTILPNGMNWSWEEIPHEIADNNCTCGIYVVNQPHQCTSYLGKDCVIAEISLWGRVVPGSDGARGQYAYPRQLFAPDTLADVAPLVAELYGIPIGYRNSKTGATITLQQALENLDAMKRGTKPTAKTKQPILRITATRVAPVTPLLQPGPILPMHNPQPAPSQPSLISKLTQTGAILPTTPPTPDRQHQVELKTIYVLSWIAILTVWIASITISPYLLIGVLPLFLVQHALRQS